MKIFIKNKKWETHFKNVKLVCDVNWKEDICKINFLYRGKKISITSNNLDKTFKYLENIFDNIDIAKIPVESRIMV